MKHTVKQIEPSKVEVAVVADKEPWQAAQGKAFEKLAEKVSIPGFRPGKAPAELVKGKIDPNKIFDEAINEILPNLFAQVVTDEKLRPFTRPEVNVTKVSDTELELTFTIVLVPDVTLGEYKGLHAEKKAPGVAEKEVDDAITKLLANNANLVVIDRAAKTGDTVVFDFDGYTKDEKGVMQPFDGGKAENYSLELGSHSFVPGFEEALVGVKTGDAKDIVITFPTNYVKELAGKEATFKCVIHEIKEKQIPALTDEAVKDAAIKDVTTVAQLRDYEKNDLLAKKVADADTEYYNAIVKQIVDASKVIVAKEIIADEAAGLEDNLKKQVEQQGLTLEQYLSITGQKDDDLKKKFSEEAEANVKSFLVLDKISDVEKIDVTDAEVDLEVGKIADQYKMKPEEVKGILEKNLERFKQELRQRKLHDFIVKNSK